MDEHETSGMWWHYFGGEVYGLTVDPDGEAWVEVIVGKSTMPPDQVAMRYPSRVTPVGTGTLAYITSFDHDPTDDERAAVEVAERDHPCMHSGDDGYFCLLDAGHRGDHEFQCRHLDDGWCCVRDAGHNGEHEYHADRVTAEGFCDAKKGDPELAGWSHCCRLHRDHDGPHECMECDETWENADA